MKKLLFLTFALVCSSSNAHFHLDFTLSDFCYQQPNVQDRTGTSDLYVTNWHHVKHDGVYYFPNEEEGITATSLCVFKDKFGQFDSKGSLKKGKKNGKWVHWHSNGQKWVEANWRDGKKDGLWTVWRKDGSKKYEENWKSNKEEGSWTWWNSDGSIDLEGAWKDGKPYDEWLWYRDGSIDQIGTFSSEGFKSSCKGPDGENKEETATTQDGKEFTFIRVYDCEIFTSWRDNFNQYK